MPVPLERFVQQLEDSGVLAGDTLKDFLPPKGEPKDAEELARELVRQRKLTKFQVEEVSKGKGKSLVLGNYVLLEKIGAGGMGQVFKARHQRMDRLVAVKLLPTAMTKNIDAIARFEREVKAAAKLRHPNIIAADDADQANGVHFLVMEFVDGSDLSAHVKKNGPFSIELAVAYVLQAARGLEFAHKKGVIHRDIKPANLLLDSEGTVKILDMGLARIHGDPSQAELTASGAVMGTVDFMAPEQALSTKTADARADIYSLGCSLFYLLTGKATYDGDTLMAKLLAHRDQPIPNLYAVRPDIPKSLDAIFRKMVEKKTDDRYQTMTEVVAALESWKPGASDTIELQTSEVTSRPQRKANSSQTISATEAITKPRPQSTAKPKATVADEVELNFLEDLPQATSRSIRTKKPAKRSKGKNSFFSDPKVLMMGGGAAVVILLAVVMLTLRTSSGTLVVTVNEPEAEVEVLSEKDTVEIKRKGDAGPIRITVDAGKHRLKVQKDGFELFTKEFEIVSGGTRSIAAQLVPHETKPGATNPSQVTTTPSQTAVPARAGSALEGTWKSIGEEVSGQKWDAKVVEDGKRRVTFRLDSFTMFREYKGTPGKYAGTYRIDPQTRFFDFDGVGPSGNKVQFRGIYELNGDSLRLCYRYVNNDATSRPTAFRTDDGNGAISVILELQRETGKPPADAVAFNGHSYKFFSDVLNWHQAKARCEEMGGHLPIIETEAENTFVTDLAKKSVVPLGEMDGVWLGGTDELQEGEWKWINGQKLVYTRWNPGQPNNKQNEEHYMMLWIPKAEWADQPVQSAQHKTYLICEWDSIPSITGSNAAAKQEWVSLFNGKDLNGWKPNPGDTAQWEVRNGILTGFGPGVGHLYSQRDDYANFHFRMEVKVGDKGNSGQYFRAKPQSGNFPLGYEAQINSTHADPVRTGSLYNLVAVNETPIKPDEWFTQEVIAEGNHIRILVNGNPTVDFNDLKNTYTTGHFALQHNRGSDGKETVVEFRKIEVKELPSWAK